MHWLHETLCEDVPLPWCVAVSTRQEDNAGGSQHSVRLHPFDESHRAVGGELLIENYDRERIFRGSGVLEQRDGLFGCGSGIVWRGERVVANAQSVQFLAKHTAA
jgi:hypothetical protein